MPITKTMAYKVGEEAFSTIKAAQFAAIIDLFNDCYHAIPEPKSAMSTALEVHEAIANMILDHSVQLIDILTYDPDNEKPARKPRSDKGKKRAEKEAAINRALQDGKQ